MSAITKIGIIGAGVVGQTFAQLLSQQPQYGVTLGSRRGQVSMHAAAQNADIVLLTVADDAIQAVCQELVATQSIKPAAIVAHCSGALSSDILNSHVGAVASVHPLQTFPDVAAALPKVAGTYCYCEGDATALAALTPLIESLQMQPVTIQAKNKALYHAAAVMACNNLVALMEAALTLGEAAEIDREVMWPSLKPLIDATLQNIGQQGTKAALTGPVARGDIASVQSHLQAMHASPLLDDTVLASYQALGQQALALAEQTSPELAAALKAYAPR